MEKKLVFCRKARKEWNCANCGRVISPSDLYYFILKGNYWIRPKDEKICVRCYEREETSLNKFEEDDI